MNEYEGKEGTVTGQWHGSVGSGRKEEKENLAVPASICDEQNKAKALGRPSEKVRKW